ncbi:MAG: hypothetical protein LBU34_05180 [Planctomycetaceae bacterium]|nr:hypothetical protein [Planctomycetaceae bacterium]
MFGVVVAILALGVSGWYFWTMLKPFLCNSEDHSVCGHCRNCPISQQSSCNVLHKIGTSHEITNLSETDTDQHDQTSELIDELTDDK